MKQRVILTVICLIALTGFFLPAVNVEISFMGRTTSSSFSAASFFNRPDNRLSGLGLPQTELFDLDDASLFANAGTRLIVSAASYLTALGLLTAVTVCAALGVLMKTGIVLSAVSTGLMVYAGYTIMTVAEPIIEALNETFGFLSRIMDFSNLITITPGAGYLLTLSALGAGFVLSIIFFLKSGRRRVRDK
jgi:hypothetical protein